MSNIIRHDIKPWTELAALKHDVSFSGMFRSGEGWVGFIFTGGEHPLGIRHAVIYISDLESFQNSDLEEFCATKVKQAIISMSNHLCQIRL